MDVDGESKTQVEPATDVDVKDVEKKQSVKSELKKLQFLGAGPKAVVPDISDSGNGGDNDD